MASLRNGIFVTGSNDKTIKAWTPLESKPLGVLEEDAPITHFIKTGKPNQADVTLIYICHTAIKQLSFKSKAVQLFRNDS